jgi:hypothetical protein
LQFAAPSAHPSGGAGAPAAIRGPQGWSLCALLGGVMKTQMIDARNGAIAVHESVGQGPPVVLIHRNCIEFI